MVTVDTVVLDRITTQARQIRFSRVALTVLAGMFFAVGWVAAKTFGAVWLAMTWTAVAVKVGWQEGRKTPPKRP
jgi:hypothetical protein